MSMTTFWTTSYLTPLQFPDSTRDLPNYGWKIFFADSILTPWTVLFTVQQVFEFLFRILIQYQYLWKSMSWSGTDTIMLTVLTVVTVGFEFVRVKNADPVICVLVKNICLTVKQVNCMPTLPLLKYIIGSPTTIQI